MSQKRREERKRRIEASENSYTRRNFLKAGLGAAAAGVLGYTGYNLLQEKDPTFEEAKKDKTKRAAYVKSVVRRFGLDKLPYVEGMNYSGGKPLVYRQISPKTDLVDIIRAEIRNAYADDIGKRKKYSIDIYNHAFADSKCEDDFLNIVVDHEIEGHAKSWHYGASGFLYEDFLSVDGPDIIIPVILKDVNELHAFKVQIEKAAKERSVSNEIKRSSMQMYWYYYSDLVHPTREGRLKDESKLRKFREMFFTKSLADSEVETKQGVYPVISADMRIINTFYAPIELPDYLKAKVAAWKKSPSINSK